MKNKSTTIKFTYKDVDYELGFTRQTVSEMLEAGFDINKVSKNPIKSVTELFYKSFELKNPDTPDELKEEILEQLGDKGNLYTKLQEAFSEPVEFLFGEPEKNAIKWTA